MVPDDDAWCQAEMSSRARREIGKARRVSTWFKLNYLSAFSKFKARLLLLLVQNDIVFEYLSYHMKSINSDLVSYGETSRIICVCCQGLVPELTVPLPMISIMLF